MEDNFDTILSTLGTGKWTFLYVLSMAFWYSLLPYHTIAGVFLAPPVDHTCRPPPSAITPTLVLPPDGDASDTPPTFTNSSYQSTPPGPVYDAACSYMVEDPVTGKLVEEPCTDWDFDNSTFTSTITSEFQLVCGRKYLQATYQSMYMIGMLVGALFNGFLADRYGRWPLLAISSICYSVIAVGSAWLPTLPLIITARFFLGIMHPSSLQTGYILSMEVTEIKHRTTIGIAQFTTWAIATMLFSGWAYLFREWRWLQTAVSLPCLLFYPLLWLMDESPRWLAVVGQHERALRELKKAARWNKVTLPSDHQILAIMQRVQEQAASGKNKKNTETSITSKLLRAYNQVTIIFRTPKLRIVTLVTCFDYFVVATLFFGLTAGAPTLGVNPFIFVAISGAVEIPSSTILIPFVQYFGRKKMLICTFLVCAASLLLQPVIPEDVKWLSVTLVMLGKMFATAAFGVVWLYAMELVPTEIRTQGLGACLISSRLGAIIAPFLMAALNTLYPWAISVVFGLAAAAAGLAVWPLWETNDTHLPDTIAELESLGPELPRKQQLPLEDLGNGVSNNAEGDKRTP